MQKLTLDYILVNHILQHLMKLSLPTPLSSAPTILPITKRFWWPRTRSLPPHASATTRRGSRSNGALYIFFFRLFARSYCPLLLTFTGPYFDAHYPSDCYPYRYNLPMPSRISLPTSTGNVAIAAQTPSRSARCLSVLLPCTVSYRRCGRSICTT